MARTRKRKWDAFDEDPTSGLINLFDIWMVFAVAVLLAFVESGALKSMRGAAAASTGAEQRAESVDSSKATRIPMQVSTEQLTGQGERLGTAYRLSNGQIVYVPDRSKSGATDKK